MIKNNTFNENFPLNDFTSNIINKHIDKILNRFWSKVEKTSTCWNWKGTKIRNGYGEFYIGFKLVAHRFSYQLKYGKIPNGLQIDHLCRNTSCVNPDHLEAVTQKENILRSNGLAAINARKTHCPKGHLLSGDNLYIDPKNRRNCRKCARNSYKRYKNRGKNI